MLVFAIYFGKNNLIEEPLSKLCIASWHRNLPAIVGDYEFKIFTEDSTEYINCFNNFDKTKVANLALRYKADIFRIYILSMYSHALYLDLDTYITPHFTLPDFYFGSCWNIIYNGNNTNFFKELFENYLTLNLIGLEDKEIFSKLGLKNNKYQELPGSVHLFYIKHGEVRTYFRTNFLCILTRKKTLRQAEGEFTRKHKFLITDSIEPRTDRIHFSLYNDENLINYLKTIETIIDRTV